MCDWSNLLGDILTLIAQRLSSLPDLHRFASVCVTWREAARRIAGAFTFGAPFLMLPYDDGTRSCNFLNFSENATYSINMPELHHQFVCGASDGWLVAINDQLEINLLNPYSKAQIQLPQYPTFDLLDFVTPAYPFSRSHYISRIILSGSPTSGSDCFAIAIVSDWLRLAFCKVGGDKWITVKAGCNQYLDAMYYEGKIYAIRYCGPLIVFSVASDPKVTEIELPFYKARRGRTLRSKYVIESLGRILLVLRFEIRRGPMDDPIRFCWTNDFFVFQLNQETGGWNKVKTLGDRSLFLGRNRSFCMSVTDCPGFRENCIYFLDDCLDPVPTDISCYEAAGYLIDCGVFSLEDSQIEPLTPSPIWRTPAFWHVQCL